MLAFQKNLYYNRDTNLKRRKKDYEKEFCNHFRSEQRGTFAVT